ncbi:MAG: hypothetical protein HW407_1310, partial [Bacteroidetes bacterium]|nr:hypothetical protein [Bacteroidota bacterium]
PRNARSFVPAADTEGKCKTDAGDGMVFHHHHFQPVIQRELLGVNRLCKKDCWGENQEHREREPLHILSPCNAVMNVNSVWGTLNTSHVTRPYNESPLNSLILFLAVVA